MSSSTHPLPSGWAWTTLGEVVDHVPLTGLKLPQGQYEATGTLPVVDQGQKLVGGYTNREDLRIRVARPVIIFGDHTKAIKYVDFDFVAGADGIKPLVPWEVYFPKLFYYFLYALRLPDKGYARHFQFLAKSSLPLPPFPEQRRIVAKIEELFSQLDAGVEELKKAKAQLKRYRQSVLKAAFEGKLTEEWRKRIATSQEPLEPAADLLQRIREERKKALGSKYKEPPPLDTSELPELPEGWAWAFTDDLLRFVTSGSRGWAKYYSEGGPLFIRIGNLDHDSIRLDLADVQRVLPPEGTEGVRTRVLPGDILISITADVGMIALVPDDIEEAYINQHVSLARPLDELHRPYLAWYLASRDGGQRQFLRFQRGATKTGLGLDDIRSVAVPVSPRPEQQRVVEEIDRRLSVADAEDKAIEAALRQAARLRQSILKRAFEGRLVPQDPSDPPATELLARIKAEKTGRAAGRPRGRGRRAVR